MRPAEPPLTSVAGADEADDLGPVLLEKRPKPLAADLFLVLAALFLIPTALTPFVADFRTGVVLGPVLAAAGALLGILGILYILTNAGKASYLHERGLRVRDGKGWRVVRYEDVTEMTFRATRMYYNGAYTGTLQEIGVKTDESGNRPLVFKHSYRERSGLQTGYRDATPLNHLCDLLTAQIARRMADRLGRGESVEWTPAMRISSRGVEVVNRAGAADDVDWDRIARVDVERGVFRLWVEGVDKPRVEVPVGGPNFFPGYALVLQRLQGQPAIPAAHGAARRRIDPVGRNGEYTDRVHTDRGRQRRADALVPLGDAGGAEGVGDPGLDASAGRDRHRAADRANQPVQPRHARGERRRRRDPGRRAAAAAAPGLAASGARPNAAVARAAGGAGGSRTRARADPFGRREVLLTPEGYAIHTPNGQGRHGWNEVSRVEWFDGYVFVFLAADRVRREMVGLILPPRAFHGRWAAEEACAHLDLARGGAIRRRFFRPSCHGPAVA